MNTKELCRSVLICVIYIYIFLYLSGLIIGAVITYSSPANEITSENVTLPINSSFNAYNYPNAVKLFIPVVNHTEPKIYQYSHPEEQSQAQQQEKILEEKVRVTVVAVSVFVCLFVSVFVCLSYLTMGLINK